MSIAWHAIRDHLTDSSSKLHFQRSFDAIRRAQAALTPFRDPAALLDGLHRTPGDPARKNVILPAGTVHLPDWADAEWLKQLTAEQLVTVKSRRGFSKLEWQKLRERNEALDIRIYARAAAWILGVDRWPEARWQELDGQFKVVDGAGKEAAARSEQTRAPRSSARRKTVRSSYMG